MLIHWQCLILTSIYIPAQGSCWNLGYKKWQTMKEVMSLDVCLFRCMGPGASGYGINLRIWTTRSDNH